MKREIEKIMQKVRQHEISVIDGTEQVLNLSNVVNSELRIDKAHYSALTECANKILDKVEAGQVPRKDIIGLKILMGR